MARSFAGNGTQYLRTSAMAETLELPLTLACWARRDSGSGYGNPLHVGSMSQRCTPIIGWPASGDVTAFCQAGGWISVSKSGFTNGVWHHVAGTFAAGSLAAFLDAHASASANYYSPQMYEIDVATEGGTSSPDTSPFSYAELGIWSAILTDHEIAALAGGVCPLLVRPSALKYYWPLRGNHVNQIEAVNALSVTGTVTWTDHPRLFLPGHVIMGTPAASVTPSVSTLFRTGSFRRGSRGASLWAT